MGSPISHVTNFGLSFAFGCNAFARECSVSAWPRCFPLSISARGVGHCGREVGSVGDDSSPQIALTWAGREGEPVRPGGSESLLSRAVGVLHAAAEELRSSESIPAAFVAPRSAFRRHASESGEVGARRGSPSRADGVGQPAAATVSGIPAPFPFTPFAFSALARAAQVSGSSPSFVTLPLGVGQYCAAPANVVPPV